jgi:hypothetical protein
MSQKVTLVDDLNGEPADDTHLFSLDGSTYEIDLTAVNAGLLYEALQPFIDKARKVAKGSPAKAPAKGLVQWGERRSPRLLGEIRDWGRRNGWEVSDFGRIPRDLEEEFWKAHPGRRP